MGDTFASSDVSLGDTTTPDLSPSVLEGSDVAVISGVLEPCSRREGTESSTAIGLTVLALELAMKIGAEEESSAFTNGRATSSSVRPTANVNA